jgi:hypothetical protein
MSWRRLSTHGVIAGHSRPKDGVASLAYVPAISIRLARCVPKRDSRVNGAFTRDCDVLCPRVTAING